MAIQHSNIHTLFTMIIPFIRLLEHTNMFSLLIISWLIVFYQVNCLDFSYSSFPKSSAKHFQFNGESNLAFGALQVTNEASGNSLVNFSGRILYKKPFMLQSKKKASVGSFITKFVLRITPQSDPGGEGLAFILTKDLYYIPPNSFGPCLGIVSSVTDDPNRKEIIAVEFDTKKSYDEDLDDNHVGVDINSIKSWLQISLSRFGVDLSSDKDITAMIKYDGSTKEFNVSVSSNDTMVNVISMPLDLSDYLSSDDVYVGFSASTGTNTQWNVIREWHFKGGGDSSFPIWVWVGVSLGGTIMISSIVGFVYWRIKKAKKEQDEGSFGLEVYGIGPKRYQLKELKSATSNFDARNELGRGGFGIVYKGKLEGKEVAVKRISDNSKQGRRNLIAEVATIGCLDHKNIVKLTGWCYEKTELLLVYDYMPNGSLDKLLFPQYEEKQSVLSWERRYKIVIGVAQSLDYLHNGSSKRVLHRDIKPSNIMLDSEFNACLGDFGLARMVKRSEKTHHTTTHEIAGTRSYMAPEIFLTGKATTQTDVYAFGVLVLEVICGRRPKIRAIDEELIHSIVDWVWEFYKVGLICGVVDSKLNENYNKDDTERALLTGLACCHPNPHMRPSIRNSLQVLMKEVLPFVVPLEKPPFSWPISASSLVEEHDPSFNGGMLSSFSSFSGR